MSEGPFEIQKQSWRGDAPGLVEEFEGAFSLGPPSPHSAGPPSAAPATAEDSSGQRFGDAEAERREPHRLKEPVPPGEPHRAEIIELFSPRYSPPEDDTLWDRLSHVPVRKYDCPNYSTCLSLAAALNWESFSCEGCSGCVNQQLLWRAHHKIRDNLLMQQLCRLPVLQ